METTPSTEEKPKINNPPKDTPKEKSNKGLKTALIICIILALAGLGFGIYGMTKKPEEKPADSTATTELETELTNLKQKYSVLQTYVKDLEASGAEVSEEVKIATEAKPADSIVNTKDYIYIGSWGQKIKRPNELIYMEYKLTGFSYVECLYVNAGRAEDKNLTADGGTLSNIDIQSLGSICRAPSSYETQVMEGGRVASGKAATFAIGDYSYWYDGPNRAMDEPEAAVTELLRQMLSNPANYSAI